MVLKMALTTTTVAGETVSSINSREAIIVHPLRTDSTKRERRTQLSGRDHLVVAITEATAAAASEAISSEAAIQCATVVAIEARMPSTISSRFWDPVVAAVEAAVVALEASLASNAPTANTTIRARVAAGLVVTWQTRGPTGRDSSAALSTRWKNR